VNERVYKLLHEKNALPRFIARRLLFNLFQGLGFHVTGDHFYEIVPNTRFVAASYKDCPRELPGIDLCFSETEGRALKLLNTYGREYPKASLRWGFQERNYYFRGLDALFLYVILRELKPKKVVEIGQGLSTCIIFSALEQNAKEAGQRVKFVSVDPYVRFTRDKLPECVDFCCLRKELQSVELEPLLEGCRFLFVDSSHVYKFGSDVEYEFTRVYPKLHPQTLLHVHDIFSPYNYPRDWIVEQKRFWNEQYFLEGFLTLNAAFEIYLPVNLLARDSKALADALNGLPLEEKFKRKGGSFYLLRR